MIELLLAFLLGVFVGMLMMHSWLSDDDQEDKEALFDRIEEFLRRERNTRP